jgi:hypothetical protein
VNSPKNAKKKTIDFPKWLLSIQPSIRPIQSLENKSKVSSSSPCEEMKQDCALCDKAKERKQVQEKPRTGHTQRKPESKKRSLSSFSVGYVQTNACLRGFPLRVLYGFALFFCVSFRFEKE